MLAHTGGPPPDGRVGAARVRSSPTTPPPTRIVPPTVLTPPEHAGTRPRTADRRWQWLAAAAAVVALVVRRALARRAAATAAAAGRHRRAGAPPRRPRRAHATSTLTDAERQHARHRGRDHRRHRLPHVGAAAAPRRVSTYQLWGITPHRHDLARRARSRSRRRSRSRPRARRTSLAITTEVAGGVPVSHNAPDAVGDIA